MDVKSVLAPKIKGLREALGLSEEESTRLKRMKFEAALEKMMFYGVIVRRGGNIHGVNRSATAKRRAANKVARKARRNGR